MSCYLITVEQGRKVARPITSEEEYRKLRGSSAQLANLRLAREGNEAAKRRLIQFNYSGHYPPTADGTARPVKGHRLPSKAFGFDLDDCEAFNQASRQLLARPEEYGLLMLERSARQGGHAVFRREAGRTILENQVRMAAQLQCEMDTSAHDINRVYFTTSDAPDDLLYLSPDLFADTYDEAEVTAEARLLEERERCGHEELPQGAHRANKHFRVSLPAADTAAADTVTAETVTAETVTADTVTADTAAAPAAAEPAAPAATDTYLGIPYADIIGKWWQLYNDGQTPVRSNRDVLTYELAVNLRHICGFDRALMERVIPCYDGFPPAQKMKCIDSALAEKRTQMPRRLRDVLIALQRDRLCCGTDPDTATAEGWEESLGDLYYYNLLPRLPQGVRDSVEAAGRPLAMAALIAIAPAIGALATGVKLDVHGKARGLNLCSFIAGDFASGKGQLDDIIAAWMQELQAEADIYTLQEEEWAAKTKRMKSGKAPEQPRLPVRMLTLNNTVANIAERLANTEGKHSFSFTPEADNVALKWKQSVSDFSVMLRQAYDEARYDREAKSAEAVRVHIQKLLWNVTMCGTQDALYRVVTNYTDGLLSRLAIARTPDNTFAPLADHPAQLTPELAENIRQIAHLLPLMQGTVCLPRLEERGRRWLETVRKEALKNDDRVLARQRFRGCVNAQRITTALWLPKVAEQLIRKHGLHGAEVRLKQSPDVWIAMLLRQQTDEMLTLFDIVADYLLDNDLYYFRDRIEQAYEARSYRADAGTLRARRGRNDTIYERLTPQFTFDQALQQTLAQKGMQATRNSVHQMLKNWRKQGLIAPAPDGTWRKVVQ